jgi:hypothetical protein
MIRRGLKWLTRLLLLLALLITGLLTPVGYTELACKGTPSENTYTSLISADWQRPESRTLLTYPEWHIVHAYDDYARVIASDDPHDFGYFRATTGFWSSLCALSKASASHGGFPSETKQMVYTIGVSFTAEMLAKAAYEETLGRAATLIRGADHASLDDLSAAQAASYAKFLQQVPWYKWDFATDAAALKTNARGGFRDTERRFALGLEYRVKSAYARIIANAVANIGADELRLRMIVTGATPALLKSFEGVSLIATRPEGLEIETPRYRELTHILKAMAAQGITFVEIAGNDDILFTATSPKATTDNALFSFKRQGYGDYRHLILLKTADLAARLNAMGPLTLEHIHDY